MTIWRSTFVAVFLCLLAVTASSQTVSTCPAGFVCITPEAARAALIAQDTVKAQENQILDLKKAILDEKSITLDVKIELAKTTGQLTGVQGENVTLRALVDVLIKNARPKKNGFINLF
jgi:hypothetical protein